VTLLAFPALDEAPHVPRLAEFARTVAADGLVDRVVLLDGGSTDGSVAAAEQHGLAVAAAADLAGRSVVGKGDSVAALLRTTDADRVVFLDADVEGLGARSVECLLEALVGEVSLVKGVCRRLDPATGTVRSGRVSELVARPALELIGSRLAGLRDPLSGQVAVRTDAVRDLDLHPGYGLELSMLLGLEATRGAGSVVEVELEPIAHRHKDVDELAVVARDVMEVALATASARASWSPARSPLPSEPPESS
jgi:glucosyl-3-phosphoglycerate synthase